MVMWKTAYPVCYGSNKIGRVYLAKHKGPPLEVSETDVNEAREVVVEFEDLYKGAARKLGDEPADSICRVSMPFQ